MARALGKKRTKTLLTLMLSVLYFQSKRHVNSPKQHKEDKREARKKEEGTTDDFSEEKAVSKENPRTCPPLVRLVSRFHATTHYFGGVSAATDIMFKTLLNAHVVCCLNPRVRSGPGH